MLNTVDKNTLLHRTETRHLRDLYAALSITFNADIFFVTWHKKDYYTLTYNRKLIKDISFHSDEVLSLLLEENTLVIKLAELILNYQFDKLPIQ